MAKQRKKMEAKESSNDSEPSSDALARRPPPSEVAAAVEPPRSLVRSLRSWLNLNSRAGLLCLAYLYTTIKGMRALLYPFDEITIAPGAPSVKPLWREGTPLRLVAYLSTSPKPNPTKALNGSGTQSMPVIWEAGGVADSAQWGHIGDQVCVSV